MIGIIILLRLKEENSDSNSGIQASNSISQFFTIHLLEMHFLRRERLEQKLQPGAGGTHS